MKGIGKIASVVTKVCEIFHWVGAGLMAAAAVCALIEPSWMGYFIEFDAKECCGANLSVYGFEVNAAVTDGKVDAVAFLLFGCGAVLILALMAMIFRNLSSIVKNAEENTPFQAKNVRLFREVGYFAMGVPVVGLIMSVITRLALGVDVAEISNNFGGFVIGIVVLCITEFFARGVALEEEVDGLV